MARLDLLYAHFLVREGSVGLLPGCEVLQYHHTYLRSRTDLPTLRSRDGDLGVLSP